jgi:hypothetical protein
MTEEKAREIVKRISDAAIELAFIRHDLTSDQVDVDEDADCATRVRAVEAFCEGVKEDVLNCLTGDELGCGDEDDLNHENCPRLFLQETC